MSFSKDGFEIVNDFVEPAYIEAIKYETDNIMLGANRGGIRKPETQLYGKYDNRTAEYGRSVRPNMCRVVQVTGRSCTHSIEVNMIKAIIISTVLGVGIWFLGIQLMGYASAVAVPSSYFEFFGSHSTLSHLILGIASQLVSFSLLASISGSLIGRFVQSYGLLCVCICYLVYIAFAVLSESTGIIPDSGFLLIMLLPQALVPTSLFLFFYLGRKRITI